MKRAILQKKKKKEKKSRLQFWRDVIMSPEGADM